MWGITSTPGIKPGIVHSIRVASFPTILQHFHTPVESARKPSFQVAILHGLRTGSVMGFQGAVKGIFPLGILTECLENSLRMRVGSFFLPPAREGLHMAHRVEETRANSLSLVRFDRNDYSVPTEFAHHPVTAVGTIDQVRLIVNDRLAARHDRCWEKQKVFFEPVHYLALLERKPGAFDFARPMEGWDLPPCFDLLRRRLEADMEREALREYIKVLRLIDISSIPQLAKAIDKALSIGATNVDAIRLILEHNRQAPVALFCLDGRPHLKSVRVPPVNLAAYRSLREGA